MSAKIIEIREDITYSNLPFHSPIISSAPTGLGDEVEITIQFHTNTKLSNDAFVKLLEKIKDIVLIDKSHDLD